MTEQAPARPSRAQRQRRIIDRVVEQGFASVAELVEDAGVSVMTIHRDLDDLAGRGLLRRVHGGVSALPTGVFESSSEFRMQRQVEAKDALARTALGFVEPGMSVLLDDSTTALALARLLPTVGAVTVITNYRQVLEVLMDQDDVSVIMLGGAYSRTHDSFIGAPDASGLATYAVDVSFQSTSTIDDVRAYHQEQELVLMKRAMIGAGERSVLMIDGSKVGRRSLHRFAELSEFSDLVVTPDVPVAMRETMAEHVRLHVTDGT
ncbi:DeoR family transcriptional regulator [Aeromicrobium sp. 636]|uniref:DeoR/GlpR transcriptional regulator n=1 Tax=Aeromicrobium senzhongii TaxID=2663859 RepID=A0A8I0EX62_9ACTN|nr:MULTISPECIES: DeoR/GlpR family DNA-binding transcription regulator [Aeromicrobium]MBC9226962.1 DeoR/GlpR transcriptional regulator [Aeromicrobium senzhongii]MCQ3999062.1 DeoR family transcriptional regulator [Aeromicrobium sp. 636]